MKRLITDIDYCDECCFFQRVPYLACNFPEHRRVFEIEDNEDIPEWCPLPEAE